MPEGLPDESSLLSHADSTGPSPPESGTAVTSGGSSSDDRDAGRLAGTDWPRIDSRLPKRWLSGKGRRELAGWQKLVDACPDPQEKLFLQLRWLDPLQQITRRHSRDAFAYILLRTISIIGGLAISGLAGVGIAASSHAASWIKWLVFGLGFTVAASAGFEQMARYGPHRLLSRQARERLKRDASDYFFGPDTFTVFRNRVESELKDYNDRYQLTLTESLNPDSGSHDSLPETKESR